jgi:hypothetical protein
MHRAAERINTSIVMANEEVIIPTNLVVNVTMTGVGAAANRTTVVTFVAAHSRCIPTVVVPVVVPREVAELVKVLERTIRHVVLGHTIRFAPLQVDKALGPVHLVRVQRLRKVTGQAAVVAVGGVNTMMVEVAILIESMAMNDPQVVAMVADMKMMTIYRGLRQSLKGSAQYIIMMV